MRLAEVFRTSTFRNAALASAAFGATTLALFGFIYWQTAGLEARRIDQFVLHESLTFAREPPANLIADVDTRYARDLHRQGFAAVFTAQRQVLAGGIAAYPENLPADGNLHYVKARRIGAADTPAEAVRAVARRLSDGRLLVVGRSDHDVAKLRALVLRAMAIGLLPALLSSLCIGLFASQRALRRVNAVNTAIGRIIQGQLHERLPSPAPRGDAITLLAVSVNRMLDEIERLMEEVRGVGDDIAHDLRTPLTRLRARLEGGLSRAQSQEDLAASVQNAIADLDQAFALITALLRIGQIEGSARREGFAPVDLCAIARAAAELYQPVAELQGVALHVAASPGLTVHGDRDLLFEAAANLLDNAVKFTPPGGQVHVRAYQNGMGPVLAISDTGPGIAENERAAVLKRFYRADRSRHVPGHGLGLSLVTAILRMHEFNLHLGNAAPGLLAEIRCWPEQEGPGAKPLAAIAYATGKDNSGS